MFASGSHPRLATKWESCRQRPAWLANAHTALDRAVWAAYGWADPDPAAVPDDEILARLLALNLERAGGDPAR